MRSILFDAEPAHTALHFTSWWVSPALTFQGYTGTLHRPMCLFHCIVKNSLPGHMEEHISVWCTQPTAQHEPSWRHTSGRTCPLLWEQALALSLFTSITHVWNYPRAYRPPYIDEVPCKTRNGVQTVAIILHTLYVHALDVCALMIHHNHAVLPHVGYFNYS